MKLFTFYLKTGFSQLWREKRCSGILILTAAVTCTAILVLLQLLQAVQAPAEELLLQQRTYETSFEALRSAEAAENSKALFHYLQDNTDLPPCQEIKGLQGQTVDYILSSYWKDGKEHSRAEQWSFFMAEQPGDAPVILGRDFLPEEIQNGENVILLSQDWCNANSVSYKVGDQVELGDCSYQVVGFVSGHLHYMPLTTVLQSNRIAIIWNDIVFSKNLTGEQGSLLQAKLEPLGISVKSRYEMQEEQFKPEVIYYPIIILVLLTVCGITMGRIFHYLWLSQRYENAVYRQCGARPGQTRTILWLQVVQILLISVLLSFGFYKLFTPVLTYFYIGVVI